MTDLTSHYFAHAAAVAAKKRGESAVEETFLIRAVEMIEKDEVKADRAFPGDLDLSAVHRLATQLEKKASTSH